MKDIITLLDPLLEDLRSDKIKQREAATKDLHTLLRDRVRVTELAAAGEDNNALWTDLLKAVFRCVEEEKKAAVKKGVDKASAVQLRRLSDAASLLRTVLTHFAGCLNRRQLLDVLRHTLSLLEHNGALFAPVALDYLKALKAVFAHAQHTANLDPGEWEGLACTLTRAAFDDDLGGRGAALLEERFTGKEARGADLVAELRTGEEATSAGKGEGKAGASSGMDVDEQNDNEDATSVSTTATGSRKRSRAPSARPAPPTPGISQRPSPSQAPTATQLFSTATAAKALSAQGQTGQRTISQTQIAIFSLLLTLLQNPHALPLLAASLAPPTQPGADGIHQPVAFPKSHVAMALLYKLLRFLLFYPETTSHLAVLKSANLILSVTQLNHLRPLAKFSSRLLPTALRLWRTTKSRDVKDQLLVLLRRTLPFVARDLPPEFGGLPSAREQREEAAVGEEDDGVDAGVRLERMREALDEEADNRWGVGGLVLECLRLEIAPAGETQSAFVAKTFRSGAKFDAGQATAWATLELQADVYAALNAMHHTDAPSFTATPLSTAKRRRTSSRDVLDGLLDSIDLAPTLLLRVARLQLLLFVLHRHAQLVRGREKEVIKALLGTLAHDDTAVQSWAFVSLAMLASTGPDKGRSPLHIGGGQDKVLPKSPFVSPAPNGPATDLSDLWEQVWTYAVRRLSVPPVSRAAAHAALAIARKALVPVIQLQADVEGVLQNLEVQGPAAPSEAVCAFLAEALAVTSGSVRLFRLNLEDRVLGWLVGAWSVVDGSSGRVGAQGGRTREDSYTPNDLLALLGAICRFEHRPSLVSEEPLPESPVVDCVVEDVRSNVLRDFVLFNRVHASDLRRPQPSTSSSSSFASTYQPSSVARPSQTFSEPPLLELKNLDGRARKASDFLFKTLDLLCAEWDELDAFVSITADRTRRVLDTAVVALAFAGALELNGIAPGRKMVKRACALVLAVLPALDKGRLRLADTATVVKGLEALVRVEPSLAAVERNTTFLPPGPMTGIRRDLLPAVVDEEASLMAETGARRRLLHLIWHGLDIQDAFNQVQEVLQTLLRLAVGLDNEDTSAEDVDMDETMAASSVLESLDSTPMVVLEQGVGGDPGLYFPSRTADWLILTCFTTLTCGMALFNGSPEPVRHKEFFEVLANADGGPFVALGTVISAAIRDGWLHVSHASADVVLEAFQYFLPSYQYRRNEHMHALLIAFLDATAELWVEASLTTRTDFALHARTLVEYLVRQHVAGKLRSPALRIQLLRFLERLLRLDPQQEVWQQIETEADSRLLQVLHSALRDVDVQVRFEAAAILPRLYDFVAELVAHPFVDFTAAYLETAVVSFGQNVTNVIFFANVLVRSTVLRRVAYYHYLDLARREGMLPHLQCAIEAVAAVLGFSSLFELWKVYATSVIISSMKDSPDSEWEPAPSLIGSTSQQKNARSLLQDLGPVLIGKGLLGRFDDLVLASGLDRKDVVAECAPRTLSSLLCNALKTAAVSPAGAVADVGKLLVEAGCKRSIRDIATKNLDIILAQAFSELINPTEIEEDLSETEAQLEVQAFYRDLSRPIPDIYRWDSLLMPRSRALAIFRVHDWALQMAQLDPTFLPPIAFNTIYQLFSRIGHSPLVVEQIRGVYSITYFVACQQATFRASVPLLRNLMHLALVLMEQDELAPIVDALLHWGLDQLSLASASGGNETTGSRSPTLAGFVEIFLRIAHIADRLDAPDRAPQLVHVATALLTKVEEVLSQLHSGMNEDWHAIVKAAVALWPRAFFKDDLQALKNSSELTVLVNILHDQDLSTSKFPLVHRFRDLIPAFSNGERVKFSSDWFWQLKTSIPPATSLDQDLGQVHDFLALLQVVRVQAPSLSAIKHLTTGKQAPPAGRSAPAGEEGSGKSREDAVKRGEDSAKTRIILALVHLLDSTDVPTIDTCYHVLQGVAQSADALVSSSSFRKASPDVVKQLQLMGETSIRVHGLSAALLTDIYTAVPITGVVSPSAWISKLAAYLSRVLVVQDDLYGYLLPLLETNPGFAGKILPFLVQALLVVNEVVTGPQSPRELLSTYFAAVLRHPLAGTPVKQAVIDIVLHLRQIPSTVSSDLLAHERWLNLDHLLLARAAVDCKAYTTGLLFLELRHQAAQVAPSEEENQVLFAIYSNIEDPDGFYGVKSTDWRSLLVQKLHHEDRWAQAFAFHGADYRYAPAPSSAEGVYRSLHSFGFDHMALKLAQNGNAQAGGTDIKDDLGYDLAWRTNTWDVPVQPPASSSAPLSSNALLYSALRAVHNERSASLVQSTLTDAIKTELSRMRSLSIESMSELRTSQLTLICLHEIQHWLDIGANPAFTDQQWSDALPWFGDDHDFADLEKLVSVRTSLLHTVASRKTSIVSEDVPAVRTAQKQLQLKLGALARGTDHLQSAINAVTMAQKLDDPFSPDLAVQHEYANVLWKGEEHGMAIDIQRKLLDDPSLTAGDEGTKLLKARHLSLLGDWMSTARLDTAARTESAYFTPAVQLLDGVASSKEHGLVYHRFAMFAESQFRALEKSPEIERLRLYGERQKQEMADLSRSSRKLKTGASRDSTDSSHFERLSKTLSEDEEKIRAHEDTLQALLRNAIDMFGKALAVTDEFDDSLLRLASLWTGYQTREDTHANVKTTMAAIPSHKFIRIVSQLSARLEDAHSQFQLILHALFERLVAEHPFHSLYQLLMIRGFGPSVQKDGERRRSGGSSRGLTASARGQDDGPRSSRSFAAEKILLKCGKRSSTAAGRIKDVDLFCDAAIEWAFVPPDSMKQPPTQKKSNNFLMNPRLKMAQISNLNIPIPTETLPVDLTCKYRRIVTVRRFRENWKKAGGLHAPKITFCIGTDGRSYSQLYKSNDDLRQDAVMEQLFDIINSMLDKDPKTRSRHLHMRTYKVVPLGPAAGFIEFVNDTIALDTVLRSAHQRYYPNDPSLKDLRASIQDWQQSCSREQIGRRFAAATAKVHPVMRHFFTERHKTPLAWFTMRLQYARSVATTSMMGHVVGLGDRHCSNILVHEKTGEVVHIDLGVAFDAGRQLRVPELVPFRLTADIVDGLGLSGVEGVFRRCAEETLRVMRDGVGTIMTVLEVFKHDPMHAWGVPADKQNRIQGTVPPGGGVERAHDPDLIRDATDEDADRALTSVRLKLGRALSVEYTVNDLIQTARDPANLGSIFIGWQPWL